VQKVDRITVEVPHDIPCVNPEQVLSITHPKLKTTMTAGSGIKRVFARSVTRSPRRQSRRSASPCQRRGEGGGTDRVELRKQALEEGAAGGMAATDNRSPVWRSRTDGATAYALYSNEGYKLAVVLTLLITLLVPTLVRSGSRAGLAGISTGATPSERVRFASWPERAPRRDLHAPRVPRRVMGR
jgi:hypothetical protein